MKNNVENATDPPQMQQQQQSTQQPHSPSQPLLESRVQVSRNSGSQKGEIDYYYYYGGRRSRRKIPPEGCTSDGSFDCKRWSQEDPHDNIGPYSPKWSPIPMHTGFSGKPPPPSVAPTAARATAGRSNVGSLGEHAPRCRISTNERSSRIRPTFLQKVI
ncbi:uncharacterized protein LOC129771365 [Toxorhynchites rutilus septentrionalis]|uniref:uncharacterized protein LOC129771365 n=1 Tax=Toxorhynchites rutilus septentrionalis TaxID=329112 RepID=UPI00247A0AEE|nr:uncharacterized protein LOC129771365 [Toxorhynchites rutilus septentrionalis]